MLKRRHFIFAADAFREAIRRRIHEGNLVTEPPTPTIFIELGRACFLMGSVEDAVKYAQSAFRSAQSGENDSPGRNLTGSQRLVYMSMARDAILTWSPECDASKRILMEERSARRLQNCYRRRKAYELAVLKRNSVLRLQRTFRGHLGRLRARNHRMATATLRRRLRAFTRKWACEMRRAKLCNAIASKQILIRARRTRRLVMNMFRVSTMTARRARRVRVRVFQCFRDAVRMREIAISRCHVIRKVWWWRLAGESFERWRVLVARRLQLKQRVRFVRGRTTKFHFEAWRDFTRLSRCVRESTRVTILAAKNACRFSAIASLQPQRAEETVEKIKRQAEIDRVIERNGVLGRIIRRVFAVKCLRAWHEIARMMVSIFCFVSFFYIVNVH